jgi:lysophospholipase L1-like esterase
LIRATIKRITVFFVGVFVALVCLEMGLRLAGFIYHKNTDIVNNPLGKMAGKPYVILCLGNSYTKGTGAPREMSYPAQLQRIFDERIRDRKVVVVNEGHGQQNTAELLSDLRPDIRKYRPDLIILQTGEPNSWNYLKYTDYLGKKEIGSSCFKWFKYHLMGLLYESRVYRLGMLFDYNKRQRGKQAVSPAYQKEEKYLKAVKFRRSIEFLENPLVAPEQAEEGIRLFTEAIRRDPDQPQNYYEAGFLYGTQKKYEEALKWYYKSLTVALGCADGRHWTVNAFRRIREMKKSYKGPRNEGINKKIDALICLYNRRHPGQNFNFAGLKDAEISEWVRSDMNEIVRIIQQGNVRVIVQNYPKEFPVNAILSDLCGKLRLPFVDNYSAFQDKMAHGTGEQDLFVPDGHCSAGGNRLTAENVFDKILTEKFLK